MSDVVAIFGGPTGQPEPNTNTIEALESYLEMARSGQIIGVVIIGLCADGLSQYNVGGYVGGYSMLGALEVAKMDMLEVIRQ